MALDSGSGTHASVREREQRGTRETAVGFRYIVVL